MTGKQRRKGKRAARRTKNHLHDWETQSNSQVNHNLTALFSLGDCHRLHGGNVIEAAVDAERCSWDRNRGADDKFR